MPASETANASYALDEIWPREAALLREQLLAAASIDAMFSILSRALLQRLRQGHVVHPAVSFAAARFSASETESFQSSNRVKDVVDSLGMSSRHFKDLFLRQTGLTPKAFQRVRRFQQVLKALHRGSQYASADLAAACGYYDQAHFIHDFKHFSGMTPGEYNAVATQHLNHLPLESSRL
jgi:AraC-like DNA-binding protein